MIPLPVQYVHMILPLGCEWRRNYLVTLLIQISLILNKQADLDLPWPPYTMLV